MKKIELTPAQINRIKKLWKLKRKRITIYRDIADIVECSTTTVAKVVYEYEKYRLKK